MKGGYQKPHGDLCQDLGCSETLWKRRRMTNLVTNSKFSLHKAKAAKCWRKVGKEVGR